MDAEAVEAALMRRRAGWKLDARLDRIERLTAMLGAPQAAYPVIHVAGTNGKTSTTRMIEALLRGTGLRTGMITGPELRVMRERICLDGAVVEPDVFVAGFRKVLPYAEAVDREGPGRVGFFEMLTAMAFDVFAAHGIDVAVVEAGLGGALDATNVADGRVAVVTPISLDHTRLLGPTVKAIAEEKAGIIKPGAHAVLTRQPPEAGGTLRDRAAGLGATVLEEGRDFGVRDRRPVEGGQVLRLYAPGADYDEVFLPLLGAHQAQNAASALAAVSAFGGGGVGRENIRDAFAAATSPGRLEIVRNTPPVIVDAAHNPAGMAATVAAVRESYGCAARFVGVVAVMADKDAEGVIAHLPALLDEIVVTHNSSPRSMPVDDLRRLAAAAFPPGRVHAAAHLGKAIELALTRARDTAAGVLITGSVTTAGQARGALAKAGPARQ